MKLTPKSKLKVGDLLLNQKTGTTLLLLEKELVDTPAINPAHKAHGSVPKPAVPYIKKVAFWKMYVTTIAIIDEEYDGPMHKGGAVPSPMRPGMKTSKEKNLREKVESGRLKLVRKN